MTLFEGVMWRRGEDETLAQAIRAAARRCRNGLGWKPRVTLVHVSEAGVKVKGMEIRPSLYIGSPGLVFVGRDLI